jgi:uncharacterized SAM-binding protein YcdF (DUF218 family)
MKLSEINVDRLTQEQITKILYGDAKDDGEKGDCIFVYGGRGIERVHKAVELYKQGRAKYILFTGGLVYGKYTYPEALKMRDEALILGIPEDKILVEDRSNHTKENAIASLFVLENKFGIHNIKHLLVVSIPYHYKRSILTLKTYYPKWIDYTWCPANYKNHQAYNWWKDSESYEYVTNEINNLVKFVREGQLIDVEIEF